VEAVAGDVADRRDRRAEEGVREARRERREERPVAAREHVDTAGAPGVDVADHEVEDGVAVPVDGGAAPETEAERAGGHRDAIAQRTLHVTDADVARS